jgi:hypothetical protein
VRRLVGEPEVVVAWKRERVEPVADQVDARNQQNERPPLGAIVATRHLHGRPDQRNERTDGRHDWAPAARAFHPPQLQTGAVALWRSATGAASELDLLADRVIPCPTAAGRLSSAKLPGNDVIDELRVARPESDPALALDNERGEGTGRELLLEPRQVSTP